ncbi:MAG: hypothetical protein ACR2O6_09280 [Ilumatobacteraceae bacterium]
MIFAQVVAVGAGAVLMLVTLASAIRAVVVPRGEHVALTRWTTGAVRWVSVRVARRASTAERRELILARSAPIGLMLLPLLWSALIILGCALMFWGFDTDRSVTDAFALSGSSLTTLGIRSADDVASISLAVFEALLGLGIMALLISFLPTMYSAFSAREVPVAKLFLRVNGPRGEPDQAAMLIRWWAVGAVDQLPELWAEWEDWFISLQESHTSFPALVFFRSPNPNRSWITAAGLALDQASLMLSAVDVETEPRAALMIRTGTLSLREVADYFEIQHDTDPAPTDPVSVSREELFAVCDELAAAGVPVRADREQAWRDFQGWRVNYDTVLLELCRLIEAPPAPWSSDRVDTMIDDMGVSDGDLGR